MAEQRIYRKKLDNYDFRKDLLANPQGGLNSEIEDNISNIAGTAKKMMKKRKAIYDWKTTNKSFLDLYKILQKLGIRNNKFFLKIYDRDLIGIDIYKTMLPQDMQLKVLLECIINPWYYLRQVSRIPVDGLPIEPGGGSEFIADRNNIASWYVFLNGIDHYDSKSRQLGKTQNVVAQINYGFHFGAMAATMLFFAKDFTLAKQNLYRLKCQRDMMPYWLQMRMSYKDDGAVDKGQNSVTIVRNPVTNNTIKVMPRATSADAAIQLGRGETSSWYWNDEYDFTPFNNEIMDAAAFAYSTSSKNAKKHKSLYGRFLTSTPGYLNTKSGKDADKRIQRMLVWNDHFYDEPINKIHKQLQSNKCNGWMFVEHSWRQLGKSLEWYADQCKLVDYDTDKILREIELQRIQGNELSPFKKQNLVYITQNKKTPIDKLDLNNDLMPIMVYEKINKKITYILSIDPAEGLSLNNTAFVLLNPHTQMVTAEYKSPYISPPDFFRMICKFVKEYVNRCMIVIESNRGRELINRFLESPYRYILWYDPDKLAAKKVITTDKYGEQRKAANERRQLGFDTTKSSKPLLFNIIERFMVEELDKICTEYLVKDIASVQRKPNGAIILGGNNDDDEEGEGHGDVLMAYLIALFVLFNAKNLESFGIIPGASEPKDDSELSLEEKKAKIKSVMGYLPENVQEIFKGFLKQTDPVEEAHKYQSEIAEEMRLIESKYNANSSGNNFGPGSQMVDPLQQDSLWNSINKNIYGGHNQYNDQNDDSSYSNNFDVNNWI